MSAGEPTISDIRRELDAIILQVAPRYMMPRFGRVTRWLPDGEIEGTSVTRERPQVGVELLTLDAVAGAWVVDKAFEGETLLDVPSVFASGDGSVAMYGVIAAGTLVRVGFYEGAAAWPYLDAVLGPVTPAPKAQFVLKAGEATITVEGDGTLKLDAPKLIINGGDKGVARLNDGVTVTILPGKLGTDSMGKPIPESTVTITQAEISAASEGVTCG